MRASTQSLLITIPLLIGLWMVPVHAFEGFHHPEKNKLRCRTACHLPENLKQARDDRFSKPECKRCHTGASSEKPFSPFMAQEDSQPNRSQQSPRPARPAAAPAPEDTGNKTARVPPPDDMVYVEAGEFIMGSNERWDDESPEHINETGAYFIDRYEITNEQYQKFVADTGRDPPHHWPEGKFPASKASHPVIYVNWFDAHDYCEWAGKRLPNEEEWEKAARGPDGLIYPWGNVWSLDKSNNPYNGSTGTQPIGSYPEGRSPYGLYDMSGNVWEWVDAFYLPHPGNTIPKPEYGKDKRVLKGGSWFDCLSYGCGISAPTFNRAFFNPDVRNNSFGFRCAKTAPLKAAGKP